MDPTAPMPPSAGDGGDEVLLDVVVTPHRSLSPRGFTLLMILIGAVSFITGTLFVIAGAWPVMGFLGLDVALIWLAFRLNYRGARAREHLFLTRRSLTVRRFDARGRETTLTLQPYWLRVELDGADQGAALRLASHGRAHVIGACLSPPERASLAEALRAALARARVLPDFVPAPERT